MMARALYVNQNLHSYRIFVSLRFLWGALPMLLHFSFLQINSEEKKYQNLKNTAYYGTYQNKYN